MFCLPCQILRPFSRKSPPNWVFGKRSPGQDSKSASNHLRNWNCSGPRPPGISQSLSTSWPQNRDPPAMQKRRTLCVWGMCYSGELTTSALLRTKKKGSLVRWKEHYFRKKKKQALNLHKELSRHKAYSTWMWSGWSNGHWRGNKIGNSFTMTRHSFHLSIT